MAWYNNDWTYRKKVTVANAQVPGNLSGFPMLLSFTFGANEKGNVKAAGADIRVTTSDGQTEVPREIESFNASSGVFVGWTKVDLNSGTDTIFYVYYGNAAASEPATDATYGSENVWDSNYLAVWHLNEDPTSAITDSTSYDRDGTNSGIDSGDQIPGKVDGSLNLDGAGEHFNRAWDSALNLLTDMTLEAWVKVSGTTRGGLTDKFSAGGAFPGYNHRRPGSEASPRG